MSEVNTEVGVLSKMNRELSNSTLEELKGTSGKYAERLKRVADATFMRGDLLGGTTIGGPSVLAYGRKNRLREVNVKRAMYVRDMKTPEGTLTMFPLHIVGVTNEGVPIIDTDTEGSYAVVHIPNGSQSDRHNPAGMVIDLAFTVDEDNLVTVNGQNTVTADEYELFDSIVREFERRAETE